MAKWSVNIRNELIASSPVYIEFQQFKEKLNEEIDNRFANTTECFTREEIDDLKATLEELGCRMEELYSRNELTEQELATVKETLDLLKEDTQTLPKRSWYRVAGNKLANMMSRFVTSKPGQKLLEEGTRKLIETIPD